MPSTSCRPAPPDRFHHGDVRGLRIGLMGGSFNPAHCGHLMIAQLALKRLQLDRIWWLVSPQNPLKSDEDMAPLADRLHAARGVARHPRIHVSSAETALGTTYSADTVRLLQRRLPRARFVWIMGADNLQQLSQWRDWLTLTRRVGVAVFDRPGYTRSAISAPAARRLARFRLPERRAKRLSRHRPPVWVYCHTPLNPVSSTALRNRDRSAAATGGAGETR